MWLLPGHLGNTRVFFSGVRSSEDWGWGIPGYLCSNSVQNLLLKGPDPHEERDRHEMLKIWPRSGVGGWRYLRTQQFLPFINGGNSRTTVRRGPSGVEGGVESVPGGRQGTLVLLQFGGGIVLPLGRQWATGWRSYVLAAVTWSSYFSCQWGSCLLPESHLFPDKINLIVKENFHFLSGRRRKAKFQHLEPHKQSVWERL